MAAPSATLAPDEPAPKLLTETPQCHRCRKLPVRPFDPADREAGADYRPERPRKVVAGTTKRSFVCATHNRETKAHASFVARTGAKARTFGVPRAVQVALWEFQGRSCPCGRKRSKVIPAGVTLDHVHGAPCIVRGDHDEKTGCMECVTGFLCTQCNRDTVGRLERSFQKLDDPRPAVAWALRSLADHLTDPPLARLLRERPELLKEIAA